MKTSFTFKIRVAPQLLFLSVMVLFVSATAFGQVKHVVIVTDYKYTPAELRISAGDTVEWKNTQGYHNVNGTQLAFPANPESFGNSLGFGWTFKHVFKTAGKYEYHCNPHISFGMKGKIEVMESGGNNDGKFNLAINFTGMTPHVGQMLWLAVVEKNTGKEVERKKQIVTNAFSMQISGIEKDHSYFVNFYADHNKNGKYDVPPVDHAWRLELNNISGNSVLDFAHNTSFTNIEWKNKLTVQFKSMNPHVGQTLKLAVIDKTTGKELSRLAAIISADFMTDIYGIEKDKSYFIDFFADHNKNGSYDKPPTDHAWRLELLNVKSDTILMFMHNTNFTDIFNTTSSRTIQDLTLKMYPNPATDRIFIENDYITAAETMVSIYDITGKLKYKVATQNNNKIEIDIHDLINGVYYVDVRTNDRQKILKLIKY